jgi:hypothetical protein
MQLDIFEHSRDVMLRNAAMDALRSHDAVASGAAIARLASEYGGDPLLPALNKLCERLRLPVAAPLSFESASEILRLTEDAVAAAQRVFGSEAGTWLSPLWGELAAAIADLPFDPANEGLHAAPLLLLAGNWAQARARTESIPSWRRQPAPLAWKLEAECQDCGLAAAWPLLAELSWMAPRRAAALAAKLENPELNELLRRFDAEFEGESDAEDFAWFPVLTLIAEPRWAAAMRLAQPGADTPAERCARQLLNLLLLERQGRHTEIIEGRRNLRTLHPLLFDLYMRSR